jgi:hypothetical protein
VQDILQHRPAQARICDQLLQPPVLVFGLVEAPDLDHVELTNLLRER